MDAFADPLLRRYPILGRTFICHGELPGTPEPLPPFFGAFMAAMEASLTAPLCFVLPRRGDVARLAAVLYGLHRFAVTQVELTKAYGETNFKSGDRVRIHPSKHVYCFLGFDPRLPDRICLRPPDGTVRDWWSIEAAKFVPRLERTTLKHPPGKMNTPIHDPDPAPLDRLLGTSTFGNQGLFRNELVLLDSATGFQKFVESTTLQPAGTEGDFPSLKSIIPFGQLSTPTPTRASWLEKWDERNPTGEPSIAVTSSAETLAAYCINAAARSKLVVVNGLSRVKDLQSFDDIQQTQRLILIAEDDDDDLIQALGDRGCRFWELTAAELDAGRASPTTTSDGMVGKLRVWARNKEALILDAESCDNRILDDVSIRLESLRRAIDAEDQGPVTKLAARIWRVLNEAAAVVRPLRDEERQRALKQLKEFRRDLQANKAWLTPEAERAFDEAVSGIEDLITNSPDPGASKRAALERVVEDSLSAGATSVVLVRSESQALEVDQQFRSQIKSGHVKVCTPRGLKADHVFDRLVCVSWPTSATMQELVRSLAAPRITLLGYAFERRWLNQFNQRLGSRPQKRQIGPAQKAALVGGTPFDDSPVSVPLPPETGGTTPPADDIWVFEQRLRAARKGSAAISTDASETVPARYVGFVGTTYGFLTETHSVVVVTELLAMPQGGAKQRLPEKRVGGLKPGDYIVFPESGDRELIQEKADQLLGTGAALLRKTAKLWKEALWAGSLTPAQFHKEARELGRSRHIMTIRNWFAESSQIGPGAGNDDLSEDLELIALVTDHHPLKLNLAKVIEAVKTLRSAHLSAGLRLRDVLIQRLPDVIGRVEEEGSMVDLGELGSAWIVQIESIAPSPEPRGRWDVNRLLWEESATADFELGF